VIREVGSKISGYRVSPFSTSWRKLTGRYASPFDDHWTDETPSNVLDDRGPDLDFGGVQSRYITTKDETAVRPHVLGVADYRRLFWTTAVADACWASATGLTPKMCVFNSSSHGYADDQARGRAFSRKSMGRWGHGQSTKLNNENASCKLFLPYGMKLIDQFFMKYV
jgi:hypothetical protein